MEIGSVLKDVIAACDEAGLPFLVIGGWAINAHGVSRATLDLDFMIKGADLVSMERVLKPHSYEQVYKTELFAKFRSSQNDLMDIDCLLTDEATLNKVQAEANEVEFAGLRIRVPSVMHLIAMKLHALKHNEDRRRYKDLPDVIELVRIHKLNVHGAEFRQTCLKFGTPDLYKQIVDSVG